MSDDARQSRRVGQRLRELADTWRRQQDSYPEHDEGQAAAAAVRCCADELETLVDGLEEGYK